MIERVFLQGGQEDCLGGPRPEDFGYGIGCDGHSPSSTAIVPFLHQNAVPLKVGHVFLLQFISLFPLCMEPCHSELKNTFDTGTRQTPRV